MKNYSSFRRECALRKGENCSFWMESTQCHILNCPLFGPDTSEKTKEAVKRRMTESVIFTPSDFDTTTHSSVRDLIDHARNLPPEEPSSTLAKQALHAQKPVQRMICMVCGEPITDDKFITIRDPTDIILYLHSKGKCEERHAHTERVRQEFLSRYIPYQQEDTISSSESGEEKETEAETEAGQDQTNKSN